MAFATYEVPAMAIALLPESDQSRSMDFAAYTLEWLPIAASAGNAKATFTVSADVDFVGVFVSGNATDTAAPPVENNQPQALINYSVADRLLFDKPIHWRSAVGQGGGPLPLPFPLWVSRGATCTGLLTNLTAVAYNYRITIFGFILHTYPRSQSRGY